MIYVNTHPERMIFRQHRAYLRCDALRQENRHPRADPQKLDMPDRSQTGQELVEPLVAENKSVATAQKHVAHLSVPFQITKRFLEICVQFLFADATHHAAARAVAAVTRATIRH